MKCSGESWENVALEPGEPIVLIAGRGQYPVIMGSRILKAGHPLSVIAVDDEVDVQWKSSMEASWYEISIGQLGRLLHLLKKIGARHAIMAGQVKPKKLFRGMFPDLKAITLLAKLKQRNAATIFRAIAEEIEKVGVHLLDSRTFMEEDLATMGKMTSFKCSVHEEEVAFGMNIAKKVASLDIGQSVIVRKGTVIAVEDFLGTDRLIERVAEYQLSHMTFVKVTRHEQDFRFDVPVFGMRTIEKIEASGIQNVVLEAGKVIILNKSEVVQYANAHRITIQGAEIEK